MCGLNGIFAYNLAAGPPHREELIATRDHMAARGPDGFGEYWSEDRRLGLGHRRLSIIDLSDRSSQPMTSACGRYVVVFNGEIYNYPTLRRDLEQHGVAFRTTSDTEVLLHLYAREGEAMVRHLRGMFAFAVWDTQARALFLARDPYGIKPLYIADDGWTFRFASQVKALLAGARVSRDPEPAGIVGFHIWGSVPEPFTLYRDIRALPAGNMLYVDAAGAGRPRPYASIAGIFAHKTGPAAAKTDAMVQVREATLESVRAHLLADVEVGLFLSAGVDSGALLGLMKDAGQAKVRAITLAFEEFSGTSEDEAPLAVEVAQHYGADHVVRTVGEKEFRTDLPAIINAMDQPSIDGINSWFVAKAAREAGLKVALSGVGGDELLAGYPSFRDVPHWVRWMRLLSAFPCSGAAFRSFVHAFRVNEQSPKFAGLLEHGGTWAGAYMLRRAIFLPFELDLLLDPTLVSMGMKRLQAALPNAAMMQMKFPSSVARVAALESSLYLRNQLLRDCDWAGMAHSLEIRTPLVDVELARAISPVTATLSREGEGKALLAAAPSKPLPKVVSNRSKTGFTVPTERWTMAVGAKFSDNKGAASRGWGREIFESFCPDHARPYNADAGAGIH